jgi:hypothetical protein
MMYIVRGENPMSLIAVRLFHERTTVEAEEEVRVKLVTAAEGVD